MLKKLITIMKRTIDDDRSNILWAKRIYSTENGSLGDDGSF